MGELSDAKIRWKCRRGMLELDMVLERYFRESVIGMSDEDKRLFYDFLDTSDQTLLHWVFGQEDPDTNDYLRFVNDLRRLSH